MSEGILELRFAICDLASQSGAARCGHDGRDFTCLPTQRFNPVDDAQGKSLGACLEFRFRHKTSSPPSVWEDAQTFNRKSQIANP